MTTQKEQPTNILTIDLEAVNTLAIEGGKLMYTPDAEKSLVALLTLKERVDNHVEVIKGKIAAAGRVLDPNFKGVVGQYVKSIYRTYGEKYQWNGDDATPPEVLKNVTVTKVSGPAVDEYIKTHGELPRGISEKVRVPILSLTKIDYVAEPRILK